LVSRDGVQGMWDSTISCQTENTGVNKKWKVQSDVFFSPFTFHLKPEGEEFPHPRALMLTAMTSV
jgi:hypothetical protein